MQPNRAGRNHHLGVLSSGERKLEGKSFFLDCLKSRLAAALFETISNLGGVVEGFLHKDISCVVTGSQEWFKCPMAGAVREGTRGEAVSAPRPSKQPEGILITSKGNHPCTPRPMTCGSRGKALLEKAIRNQDRHKGGSVLASASSWGVKIIHVDDFLSFVKLLKTECPKVKRPEKSTKKCSTTRIVKAIALKAPFLKVEDMCRKYKPLHQQSMVFPALYLHGCRFSPFEPPPPPQPERIREQSQNKARVKVSTSEDNCQTPLLRTPSLSCVPQARRKNLGYCECCHESFKDQDKHLQSEQHRRFVQESSHYNVVEQLVVDMKPGFDPDPTQEPTASLMRFPDLETDIPSETEHAIQTLLIPGSPSCILAECPNHIARPATPCTPTKPPDPVPRSPCPDPLDQSSSPYSQPPPLSPQCLDPSDMVEPHSLFSEPPVLSPQVLHQLTEPDNAVVLLEESDPSHQTLHVALNQPPLPVYCLDHKVEGPGHDRLLVGDDPVTLGQALKAGSGGFVRSKSLPQACCMKPNLRKRSRSGSLDHSARKRRRTSLVRCQRSDPNQDFSTSWTMQEAQMLKTPTHELVDKVTLKQVETGGTEVQEHIVKQLDWNGCPKLISRTQDPIDQGRSDSSHQPALSCTLAKENCRSVVCDKTTNSLHREELGTTSPTFLFPAATTVPRMSNQTVHSTFSNRNPSRDICVRQQNLPAVPNSRFISPRDGTLCPTSSQDSHPSLSQSYSSVCIESALIPDLATPSSSNSDWDSGLVFQLEPVVPAVLPSTGGRCGLDMEMLQRPCTWMHNSSYSSHLSSALQLPVSPPSLCGDETAPLAFSRTVMQSVEIQQ